MIRCPSVDANETIHLTVLHNLQAHLGQFDRDIRRHLVNSAILALTIDGGINTVLFNLYLLRLGYGTELIGIVNAVGMGVFAVACVPVGRLSERFGLLRIMRLGMLLVFAGTLFVPLTGWMPVWVQSPMLVFSAILSNTGLACYFVSTAPYLGALSSLQQRTSVFSTQSATFAVFGFVGSLVGGNLPPLLARLGVGDLTQPLPYLWTLWLIPLLLLIPVYIVWQMRDADMADTESALPATGISTASASATRAAFLMIGLFGLIRFLQVGGVSSMQTFFNVYMDRELHISTATIGTIQAIAKLLGVPAALSIPWLTRKIGAVGAVIGALAIAALGILPLAWIPVWWVAAGGYILVWLSTPVRYAAYMVYIMSRTPSRLHGTLNGTQEGLAGLSFALIALVGGYMIQALGYSLLFTLSAVIMLIGAAILAGYEWGQRAHKV